MQLRAEPTTHPAHFRKHGEIWGVNYLNLINIALHVFLGARSEHTALLSRKKRENEILMGPALFSARRAARCRQRIPAAAAALIREVGGFPGALDAFNFHRGKQLLNFIEHS